MAMRRAHGINQIICSKNGAIVFITEIEVLCVLAIGRTEKALLIL